MADTTDWTKKLDLNRTTVTTDFVSRFEAVMRDQQTAADDLKEIAAQAAEQEFSKRDIEAMKKIAKMRLKDQVGRAREQIDALRRIGAAVQIDLFAEPD
jgi:uncharacterized protein (UPF0335 family)